MAKTTAGTIKYIAPEIMSSQKGYNEKADIWSLGCCFYEMATLNLNSVFYMDIFMNSNFYEDISKEIRKNYSDKIDSLIRMLLERNPEKRPSTSVILRILNDKIQTLEVEKINPNSFNAEIIEKVPFFKDQPDEFKSELIKLLEPVLYEKGEQIIVYNEIANEMFFINKGVVVKLFLKIHMKELCCRRLQ
jgi:serine/threonine protein kinase